LAGTPQQLRPVTAGPVKIKRVRNIKNDNNTIIIIIIILIIIIIIIKLTTYNKISDEIADGYYYILNKQSLTYAGLRSQKK